MSAAVAVEQENSSPINWRNGLLLGGSLLAIGAVISKPFRNALIVGTGAVLGWLGLRSFFNRESQHPEAPFMTPSVLANQLWDNPLTRRVTSTAREFINSARGTVSEIFNSARAAVVAPAAGVIAESAEGVRAAEVVTDGVEIGADAARTTAVAADAVDGVATATRLETILARLMPARVASKAARLGANVTGVGTAAGAVGIGAVTILHDMQRDFADALLEEGILTEESHRAYIALNQQMQAEITADTVVSTADPTGLTILATLAVDQHAKHEFEEWINEHGQMPDGTPISQDIIDGLAMNLFGVDTPQTELLETLRRNIPRSIEGQPEELHGIIQANAELRAASIEVARTTMSYGAMGHISIPDPEAEARMAQAEERLAAEMANLTSNPESMRYYLQLIPVNDRLEYARDLAASEPNPRAFAQNFPEVSAYVAAHQDAWFPGIFGVSESNALRADTALIDQYILARHGINIERELVTDADLRAADAAAADARLQAQFAATQVCAATPTDCTLRLYSDAKEALFDVTSTLINVNGVTVLTDDEIDRIAALETAADGTNPVVAYGAITEISTIIEGAMDRAEIEFIQRNMTGFQRLGRENNVAAFQSGDPAQIAEYLRTAPERELSASLYGDNLGSQIQSSAYPWQQIQDARAAFSATTSGIDEPPRPATPQMLVAGLS